MNLIYNQPSKIKVDGHIYRLRLTYKRILKALEILSIKYLTDQQKAALCCSWLAYGYVSNKKCITLLNAIFTEFLVSNRHASDGPKVIDFIQDSQYIYAGFKQTYNIDLINQDISWDKFIALFQGLPDNTKIVQIMNIRSMDIPIRDKYNSKQVDNIIKAKQYYGLESEETDYNSGLANLFNILKAKAVSK